MAGPTLGVGTLPIVTPGYTVESEVSPQIREVLIQWNTESLDALTSPNDKSFAWADIGSKVSTGAERVKVPISLPGSAQPVPFTGERIYNSINVAAIEILPVPWQLNYEWPISIDLSGNVQLQNFYGGSGRAKSFIMGYRSIKAQLVANLTYNSITSAQFGLTATQFTIPQPGNPSGLPLFTDGSSGSPLQYAHPFNPNRGRYRTFFPGSQPFQDMLPQCLTNMSQVPHPLLDNMTLGTAVTDFIGPTWMLTPFYQAAVQNLSLATTAVGGVPLAGATTNAFSRGALEEAMSRGMFIGSSGLTPWRFWIAPQLNSHPLFTNNTASGGNDNSGNMTSGPNGGPQHLWLAVSHQAGNEQTWAELGATNASFTPMTTLFGSADPQTRRSKKCSMISDFDAASAPGLPHFVEMYTTAGTAVTP